MVKINRGDDKEVLTYIYDNYHNFVILATNIWGGKAENLAGIMMRETRGGLSRLLDIQGPAGRGDFGHGHGLMQIDDRWWPQFIVQKTWKDPYTNIKFGAYVLHLKRTFFELKRALLPLNLDLDHLAIAAYNAGEGNVLRAIRNNDPIDSVTAHGDYLANVLRYAEIYKEICISRGVNVEVAVDPQPPVIT